MVGGDEFYCLQQIKQHWLLLQLYVGLANEFFIGNIGYDIFFLRKTNTNLFPKFQSNPILFVTIFTSFATSVLPECHK